MSDNILESIFLNDFLHFFVRDMFLHLDPVSLHACRQVNRHWNTFIQNEVWGKPEGRKEMEKNLLNRFKMGTPKITKINIGSELFCCRLDQNSLAAANNGGILKILNHKSIKEDTDILVKTLTCSNDSENFDMNEQFIVAGSQRGKVTVWSRDALDEEPIYETSPHERSSPSRNFISGVKVLKNFFITATANRVVTMYTHEEGKIREKTILGLPMGIINHIDADDHHILFATTNGLRFADMEKGESISLTPINEDSSEFIHHCALFYPYATYSPEDGGFKIVNVVTGRILRHLHDGGTIGVVAMNKRVVVVQDASKNCDIFIYDRSQLIDDGVQDKDLWSRTIQVGVTSDENFCEEYNYFLDVNETSIVHFSASENMIVIQDFWLGQLDNEKKRMKDN